MATLCRDCAQIAEEATRSCPNCRGQRLVAHAELSRLTVAHIDCDAFFAAVEKRDRPELKRRPVIVGGGRRGVVATCCYVARLSGVRSAMPMFKALRACPQAVVLKPDFDRYSAAASRIREKMLALTPAVQPISIDEAYLDLSGTETLHGAPPASLLARLARDIESDVGITVSIGLSSNRFLAKTASEMDKPRGFSVIAVQEAPALLAPHPVGFLHGVGPKLAGRLKRDGYERVADLQQAGLKLLVAQYAETGLFLHERAHGIDRRPVTPGGERKSVSSETTFAEDICDVEILEDLLWLVCEKTSWRAKSAGVEGSVVTLKLKGRDFRTLTRRATLSDPTQLAGTIFRAARPLLQREAQAGRYWRLIGVGLADLRAAGADAVDLIDPVVAKRASAERASDLARRKFGSDAVRTARALRLDGRRRKP